MAPSENSDTSSVPKHPNTAVGEYILKCLRQLATSRSNPAQIDAETSKELSFSELLERSIRAATGWRKLGFQPADMVAIVCNSTADIFPTMLGAMFEGLALMLVVPSMTKVEVQHHLNKLEVRAVLSEQANHAAVLDIFGPDIQHIVDGTAGCPMAVGDSDGLEQYEAVPIKDWDSHVALVLFSSGSTGIPKAVAFTNRSVAMMVVNPEGVWTHYWGPRFVSVNTLSAISGFRMNVLGVVSGATRILANYTTEREFLHIVEKYKATSFALFPPRLLLVAAEYERMPVRPDLSSLTTVLTGGCVLTTASHRRLTDTLGVPVLQLYGCTEGCGITRSRVPGRLGSVGQRAVGVQMRLVDVSSGKDITTPGALGEIRAKSIHPMKEYLGDPESTRRAFDDQGFFCTGDLAYFDEDGYFYVIDRIKELITYKDEQVAPGEIEGVLLSHPGVLEACVVGRPDLEDGSLPTALVVLKPGCSVTEQELHDLVAERLSDFKRLRGGIYFVKEIEKTMNGKFLRSFYRDKVAEDREYQRRTSNVVQAQ